MSSWPPRSKMRLDYPNKLNRIKVSNEEADISNLEPALLNSLSGFIRPIMILGTVTIDIIKNIDWEKEKQTRAGVIPYLRKDNLSYFNLGKDAKYKSLTDCGGGKNHGDLTILHTAIREWTEESLGIYGYNDTNALINIDDEKLNNSLCIRSDNMIIIMIELNSNVDMEDVSTEFILRAKKEFELENSELVWLDHNTFYKAIKDRIGPKFYILVRILISKIIDELYDILELKLD